MKLVKPFSLGFALILSITLAGCGPGSAGGDDDDDTMPNDGGTTKIDGSNQNCTGAGCAQNCPAGKTTQIIGQVFTPKGDVPVPVARVYVAKSKNEFPANVACEVCSSPADPAWVSVLTDVNGRFTLDNVPVPTGGGPVELAIQKGRFRRYFTININDCEANDLTTQTGLAKLTLPKNRSEGNLPKIAIATGDYDAMECVMGPNGFGLDATAFDRYDNLTHTFDDGLGGTDTIMGGTAGTLGNIKALIQDKAKLLTYNILFINCSGDELEKMYATDASLKANMEEYVRSGGRLYVTDWSYDWVEQVPQFAKYITFQGGAQSDTPETNSAAKVGTVPTGDSVSGKVMQPKLLDWLVAIETQLGANSVVNPKPDQVNITHWLVQWVPMIGILPLANGVGTKLWVEDAAAKSGMQSRPLTVSFDYNMCGRVLYTSYHTLGRPDPDGDGLFTPLTWREWPNYCSSMPLSAQERILEYLILEVSDCIQIG
ncbi:MAG: hypothetical protein IT370_21990 [Deltaproteobacteria bacterium]|nr:hypothetical protein [Deltaproteobacteria bacterium]